ncbi:hypothetical protein [Thalassorhabdomicrobium marinisediminis]|uniref:hypothetical protein n=1 Tax=Thalassorhabdomicrobium marinisediminis TaxID=2170577 RepID=UPI00249383A9|nr:hypothetical protein [Thalassorhabdomicrobium marinisediminis]
MEAFLNHDLHALMDDTRAGICHVNDSHHTLINQRLNRTASLHINTDAECGRRRPNELRLLEQSSNFSGANVNAAVSFDTRQLSDSHAVLVYAPKNVSQWGSQLARSFWNVRPSPCSERKRGRLL